MRRLVLALSIAIPAFSATATAQRAPEPARPIDWNAVRDEAVRTLSEYLKVNTTNPPGNELAAARYLKAILDREGIPAQILDTAQLGANRANLYARFKGNGSKRAVALANHLD